MLHSLTSNDERFQSVHFGPGLNILVAERTDISTDTDSRNGSGKSSVIELIHFLFGAQGGNKSLWANESLGRHVFTLELDWPGLREVLTVTRAAGRPNRISVYPDVTRRAPQSLFEQAAEISPKEWQWLIERDLYGSSAENAEISGRTLMSFTVRRVGSGGFLEPTRTFAQQSPHDAMVNLCHLFGLDVGLAARYRLLSNQESTRKKLVEAAKDPVWGKIVGRSAELRGEIGAVEQRLTELERQIADFQVVPEYENIRREADRIDQQIRALRASEAIERRNLQDLERAMEDVAEPDDRYMEAAYKQLNMILGREVRRRFDEVRAFHQTVVRNREKQLSEEVARLRELLSERGRRRQELGERQAVLLRTLNSGGALDALTSLQFALAREQAHLESLRHRFQAAQALEASRRDIDAQRLELEQEMIVDLEDRDAATREANALFNRYARRLYGDGKNPYLAFSPTKQRMRIEPKIEDDGSRGIHNMVIFCFDLTASVIAHRSGRGPDFLIHDSHLYDGVDERQVARALQLAAEVSEAEGMQYIVTMNSDDLQKAISVGFVADPYIIEPHLTDQPYGGLFGFRF
ncbi:ABC-three component system protein [Sphaerisporangium sp. NPDC051011]|uniref:ABC-three component system protein n=1 Tax=Sphaerisporangium sp. NPDC051011 TaxID=3155792 RepID=UPI0033FA8371